jgi:KaiC/GvpD/RAD55 family RecA-like ATPase/tetratricopeptide (TPR) repeat protein
VLKAKVPTEPALVGRERELQELSRRFGFATEGKGNTIFVSGEAGSGKTRLIAEFLKTAKKKRAALLTGWCISDAAIPYFPFIEAFNSYFSSADAKEEQIRPRKPHDRNLSRKAQLRVDELGITAWLSEARPVAKHQKLSPQVWQDQVFDGVTKTLHAISVQQPLVLVIEDIHWADSASLALLHYISRATRSKRVFILATYRSEELTTDAEGRMHPLIEELHLMRREDLLTEIKLSNLSESSVSMIAENMMDGKVSRELVSKLVEESGGNALFVVESLRMLIERESLRKENGEWSLSVNALGIPSKFRDIILRRLTWLRFDQRRVLDAASVIGEKFNVELLGIVLGMDSLEVLETLNVVSQFTSLVHVEEGLSRFDHAKSREAIYEEIPAPLRKGYHTRIAEVLERTSKTELVPWGDIAYHYAQAGNKGKAVENALLAGKDALAKFSNSEAIKQFHFVIQTVSSTPENEATRKMATEGLGDAYFASCMFDEAIKTFEDLANSETGKARLRALRKAMDAVFLRRDYPAHLMELVKKAEQYSSLDRLDGARIEYLRGKAFSQLGGKENFARGLEVQEKALRVFEEEYSLPDVAETLTGIGMGLTISNQERGLVAATRSIALCEELGDVRKELDALLTGSLAFLFWGLLEEAWGIFSKIHELSERIGEFSLMTQASLWHGRLLDIQEKYSESLQATLKALEYSQKTDVYWAMAAVYGDLVLRYAKLGEKKLAEEYYAKLMSLPKEFRSDDLLVAVYTRADSIFFTFKKPWKQASQCFDETFKLANRRGYQYLFLTARSDLAWALNQQGKPDEAKVQLEEMQKICTKVEEKFAHVNVQASLMAPYKIHVDEEFELRLDLVNVSRKPGFLIKADGLAHPNFKAAAQSSRYRMENGFIIIDKIRIDAFRVETIKLKLRALQAGMFNLNSRITFVDDLGETKDCSSNSVTIDIQPTKPMFETLPNRVSTGYVDLDALLFGGIPQNYAVALTSPSTDEREQIVKRFLEAGASAGETIFYLTAEAASTEALAEKYPSNFFLFVCNPQADAMIQSLPNVYKLKGVENLTDIDIALTKAFRRLKPSAKEAKRICLEIVSDVLLQHHAINTRRWLSALLPTLKSKGFTILAVVDPQMHPSEELQAIIGVFDGEIRVSEKEIHEGIKQTLRVRKLINQKYSDKEIVLSKEALSD